MIEIEIFHGSTFYPDTVEHARHSSRKTDSTRFKKVIFEKLVNAAAIRLFGCSQHFNYTVPHHKDFYVN